MTATKQYDEKAMADTTDPPSTLAECEERRRQLAEQIASIGFTWPGTLQRRRLTCGRPQCACHRDPNARHGPYAYWTTKYQQKTVARKLSTREAAIIEEWIENRRQIEAILKQISILSQRALELVLEEDP